MSWRALPPAIRISRPVVARASVGDVTGPDTASDVDGSRYLPPGAWARVHQDDDTRSAPHEARESRSRRESPLDVILVAPASGGAFRLRDLLPALRANGVVPHAESSDFDESFAARLVEALSASAAAATTPESSLVPSGLVGVAEGYYPRTEPVTLSAKESCGDIGGGCPDFQTDIRSQVGDYLQMLADVASMGAGRIRRVKQCDAYWACIFPYRETDATFHHYGSTVLPPADIVTAMESQDDSGNTTFAPMAATTSLIISCLCFGVKLDLSVFNGGGGLLQNFSAADGSRDAYVPRSQFPDEDTAQDVATLLAAAPRWQTGVLIPAGGTAGDDTAKAWGPFYFPDEGTASSQGELAYQQYVVNVWPTTQGEDGVTSSEFQLECRRRKCLGIAAYAFKVGDWLSRVDAALRSVGAGSIYDVVDTVDIGSEFNQFWAQPDVPHRRETIPPRTTEEEVRHGAFEVGRYFALLAGPIHAWLPNMHFRVDLETWLPVQADRTYRLDWVDGFPQELVWIRQVIADGITREVAWWRTVDTLRYGSTPDVVLDWLNSEREAGFAGPQDPYGVGLPSAGVLLHQVGVNCYHGYNRDGDDRPFTAAYASAARLASDMAKLAAVLGSIPGFNLSMVVGEIGFAAVDPGASSGGSWAPFYEGTSETLQAAMHVRTILTLLASGVESAFPYTFNFGVMPNHASYPDSGFCAWLASSSVGLHNDIAYDAASGCSSYTYKQDAQCWPRASWYADRRTLWLLNQLGAHPRARIRQIVNDWSSGLVVLRLDFATSLSADADGRSLVGLDGVTPVSPVQYAYVVWIDQYGSADEVHLKFEFPTSDTSWTLLPLVPLVTPPTSSAPGPHGYASPVAIDWTWDTTGTDAPSFSPLVGAVVGRGPPLGTHPSAPYHGSARGYRLSLHVRRCTPTRYAWPSGGVAVAPLCLLTSAAFEAP